ncbi:hypothetical protein [Streptomyces alkaliphilus]|uniref:hypothetical protein n=1 Tax=Streptomyces alkaliphilus TaxID=1472722 RepID=UPI00117C5CC4|nr:hypothetical protein [Streptomyces alkaliphilus]MQS07240.1 hypothetical protein [Streptomyces alkaliphilus]
MNQSPQKKESILIHESKNLWGTRIAILFATLAVTSLVAAPSASAKPYEGTWSSSITGAATGFNSRWWEDKNQTSNGTVIQFKSCTTVSGPAFKSVTVQLTRYRPVIADVNEGQKEFTACAGTGTSSGNWGRVQAAEYRFALMKINGNTSGHWMSVSGVTVTY